MTKQSSKERAGERYVALAEVARPHGVRGELRLKVHNPDSRVLLDRPAIRLVTADGAVREARFEAVREVPGALLARLAGVADRDGAEQLRGAQVEVSRSLLSPAEDDEYYCCDLEGCDVICGGEPIGRVEHVASYPTCDALVVLRKGKARLEVPLVPRYIESIDVAGGRIEVSAIAELE